MMKTGFVLMLISIAAFAALGLVAVNALFFEIGVISFAFGITLMLLHIKKGEAEKEGNRTPA